MEISTLRSLTDLGMDHSFLHQWQMGSVDEPFPLSMAASFNDNYYDMNLSSIPFFNQQQPPSNLFETAEINRPAKLQKTNSWGSSTTTHLITNTDYPKNGFSAMKPKMEIDFSSVSMNCPPRGDDDIVSSGSGTGSVNTWQRGTKRDRTTIPSKVADSQARDHVMAERRRREKLSQKFIALSALVPGLKRMDKASVLGDAIKYLKKLQDRVNNLEEQTTKPIMESDQVFVKNNHQLHEGQDLYNVGAKDEPVPEIEARCSGKDVLIRIHCVRRKRIQDKVVAEVDKFHLSVINSSVMSFGSSALDITIIAQKEEGFNMSIEDFVKKLDFQIQSLIRKCNEQEDTSLDYSIS